MTPGALVWFDVGGGKGEHPGVVLEVPPDAADLVVVSGTSRRWPGVECIEVDPNDPRYRASLAACLSWPTYFHATAHHYVSASVVRATRCRAPQRLTLELRRLVGRAT